MRRAPRRGAIVRRRAGREVVGWRTRNWEAKKLERGGFVSGGVGGGVGGVTDREMKARPLKEKLLWPLGKLRQPSCRRWWFVSVQTSIVTS